MDAPTNSQSFTQLPSPGAQSIGETAQQLQQAQLQLRMKNTAKKLLGNKKASKLFRLGLQQLVMNQPEYFLMASKRLIGLGQYRKAYQLLQKQLPYIDTLRIEFQPIFMHHVLHICHKLLCKFVRNQEHALDGEHDRQSHSQAATVAAAAAAAAKKKPTFSIIERINALISIQTQNLIATETILVNLNRISKSRQNQSQEERKTSPAPATTTPQTQQQFPFQSEDELDSAPPSSIENWKIEVFSESFLFYFFSTVQIGFKHFRQEGNSKAALSLLQKGTKFIEEEIDPMFGDFKGMDVYRLAGDLLLMKANVYFEAQNTITARVYYEKAFKYFHFAGQLALKRMQSTSSNNVNNGLELKVENTFSSLSLNILLIAACYDQELNFERTLEALHTSEWINSKILQYDYTAKLRIHVNDLLKEAESKYRVFLEEKGEIRRVILKGFPHLEALEAKACEKVDPKVEMINRFNSYMYEKSDAAKLNQTLVLLHGHRGGAAHSELAESARESERQQAEALMQIRSSGDNNTNTLSNFDQVVTVLVNGREQQQQLQQQSSLSTLQQQQQQSSSNQQRRIASSPSYPYNSYEKVKDGTSGAAGTGTASIDRDTQSFSDYFNIHAADNSQTKDGNSSSTFYHSNHNQSLSKTLLSSPSTHFFSPNSSLYPPHSSNTANNNNNLNHSYSTSNNLVNVTSFLPQHSKNSQQQQQQQRHEQSDFIKVQQTQASGDMTHSVANSPSHTTFRSFATPTASQQLPLHQQSYSQLLHNQQHHHQHNLNNTVDNQSKNKKKFSLGNLHAPMTSSQSTAGIRSSHHNSERVQSAMYSSSSKSALMGGSTSGGTNATSSAATLHRLANTKPKVLTTNKYFQPDLLPVSQQPPPDDFRELTSACPSQEQKYHYLNLQPTKAKKDKKQGVISLDYAMENLIKEKIIQSDLSLMQAQHQLLDHRLQMQQANAQAAQARSHLMQQQQSMILLEDGGQLSNGVQPSQQSQQNQSSSQTNKMISFALDKHVGEQIRNLMNSLKIPAQNQREIIDDLAAKFDAEKRTHFLASKSKMSQQGWTTEKILNELMRSINILGENVNTYNQRFAQFLSTIKEEDFDRSEFQTCLRKLIFRKRMGDGVIPSFFDEREQPIAIIQEMLQIDNEYVVVQSGGERMNELMSDHKIVKNYFDEVTSPTEPSTSDEVSKKDFNDGQHAAPHHDTEDQGGKHYKHKQKKIQPAKTNVFGDSRLLSSSESNVEKQMLMFGKSGSHGGVSENYFQKSQETLRQMVLQSEVDCEEMQKQIRHPKRSGAQKSNQKSRTLGFTSFSKDLASSIMPYTHRLRVQKAAGKIDNSDLLKIQNKWKNSSVKLPSPTSMSFVGTPISNRLSQTSIVNHPIASKTSAFAFKEAV